jgi:hypothetical protein
MAESGPSTWRLFHYGTSLTHKCRLEGVVAFLKSSSAWALPLPLVISVLMVFKLHMENLVAAWDKVCFCSNKAR